VPVATSAAVCLQRLVGRRYLQAEAILRNLSLKGMYRVVRSASDDNC
jgi:hypothetical protein